MGREGRGQSSPLLSLPRHMAEEALGVALPTATSRAAGADVGACRRRWKSSSARTTFLPLASGIFLPGSVRVKCDCITSTNEFTSHLSLAVFFTSPISPSSHQWTRIVAIPLPSRIWRWDAKIPWVKFRSFIRWNFHFMYVVFNLTYRVQLSNDIVRGGGWDMEFHFWIVHTESRWVGIVKTTLNWRTEVKLFFLPTGDAQWCFRKWNQQL